jgi:hypothetical protein
MKLERNNRLWLFAVVAISVAAPSVRADWGSIRGNNRYHDDHRKVEEHRVQERRIEEHREPEHVRHVDRDFEVDRQHAHYWSGFHSGMVVHGLPHGYISVHVGGRPYYYYDGVYYETNPSGFVVVTPPIGAFVTTVPTGSVALSVGGSMYFYGGGAYYVQQANGFVVVPPPLGISVAELPPGATPVSIGGNSYFLAGGTYYLPVMQGGVTVFMTVRP